MTPSAISNRPPREARSSAIKPLLYGAARVCGANRVARACFRRLLLVLAYHGVCGAAPDVPDLLGQQVPVRLFEAQVNLLVSHYHPVSLDEVRASVLEGRTLPPHSVLLTFDDGYRNLARHALPILRRQGVPCVVFPVAGAVEAGTWPWPAELEVRYTGNARSAELKRWLKTLPMPDRRRWLSTHLHPSRKRPHCDYSLMDWEELAAEIRAGGVAIGSHGLYHEPLTTCGPGELRVELAESRRLIQERLCVAAEAVAYPDGDFSWHVASAARECGYSLGFTTAARHVRSKDDPLALPRILVGPRDTPGRLAARLSGWQEWLKDN